MNIMKIISLKTMQNINESIGVPIKFVTRNVGNKIYNTSYIIITELCALVNKPSGASAGASNR